MPGQSVAAMAMDLEDEALAGGNDWADGERELSDPEIDAFLADAAMDLIRQVVAPDPTPFAPEGYDEWGRRNSDAGLRGGSAKTDEPGSDD